MHAPPPPGSTGRTPSRRRIALGAVAGLTAFALMALTAQSASADRGSGAAPVVTNPGFEAGASGWTSSGTIGAAKVESGGHDSPSRLTHWLATDGTVTTSQRVRIDGKGPFTFTASVKSGGGLAASSLTISDCGRQSSVVVPSTESDDAWLTLSVSAEVRGKACTLGLVTTGATGAWASMDDVTVTPGRVERTIRGADLSNVLKNEDLGARYLDEKGRRVDVVREFASAGANVVRLKVWVDPADGYNTTEKVVEMAKRVKRAGMQLLVDFHYSDRWTDPGAQGMPAAWVGLTPEQVTQAVYDHTREVLDALAAAHITADYVQVGNEINPGMLWPLGQTWDVVPGDGVDGAQWDNLAAFLTAGARAVKDVNADTKVILHLTNINNGIEGLTWWFDEVTARAVPFDLIGLSYYGYWHGSLADLQEAVTVLSGRYDRDVVVVETAYPFTLDDNPNVTWENVIKAPDELVPGYPATPAGQAANFRAVQDVVVSAPGGRGLGAVYWEPAWTAVPGNGWDPADPASGNAWENQAVFDFSGRALPALREFGE
jgi:arabinogalactan endo-1,4-beta-galactosidase